ncbi:SDR family oxidoreductase [Lysobacter sp. S4-A87]|uniref:SDR family oxidoreductase n=1 Tax=Lysobacter sp. S4-A87 TaxID=2925843 RepID=UPI001F5331BA|nr:SDR family oxidoreductase [Lysobacter sp. S4-A87]UNK49809.1 SDR family oxidoreductase [Lysobacter sp. S4-A87]
MIVLSGRCVVLTGASGGIGAPLAGALVRRGAHVIAVGRQAAGLEALVDQHGARAITALAADVTDPAGRQRVASAARNHSASLLVLAHAQPAFGLFDEQPERLLRSVIDANLIAPMLLIRDLMPVLANHRQAAVVAIGSTLGNLAHPGFVAYGASKFGLRGLIEGLAREHADTVVTFQHLAPRATRTAFNSAAAEAMNRELGVTHDDPAEVAERLAWAIEDGERRLQLGWPESLFVRINSLWPALVDKSLSKKLAIVRRHASARNPNKDRLEATHDQA